MQLRDLFRRKPTYQQAREAFNMAQSDEIQTIANSLTSAAQKLEAIQPPAPPDLSPIRVAAQAVETAVDGLVTKLTPSPETTPETPGEATQG